MFRSWVDLDLEFRIVKNKAVLMKTSMERFDEFISSCKKTITIYTTDGGKVEYYCVNEFMNFCFSNLDNEKYLAVLRKIVECHIKICQEDFENPMCFYSLCI